MSFAIRTFIQTAALVFTLEAALFLAKGGLGLSAENIARLASTRWGYNPNLVDSLAQQRADTWVGVIFLLVAFLLQMWNALWPFRYGDFDAHKGGGLAAVVFSVAVGIGAFYLSKHMASDTADRVKTILNAQGVAAGEGR